MAETGNPASPPVLRGAIIQLMEDLGIIIPNIIPFQYNPEKMTRGFQPWNPFEVDQTNRGAQAPMIQPYDPEETFQFALELDATDDLEDGDVLAMATGVAAQIAAIKKLIEPSQGLFGDLIASAQALVGGAVDAQMTRPSIPVSLLVMGPGLILPIRITSISIEVTEFTPTLYPHMATVTLDLRVLTPEVFKCKTTAATSLAIAAYEFTRLQEDALGVLKIASAAKSTLSMLPF
jgi:hypothetical protein